MRVICRMQCVRPGVAIIYSTEFDEYIQYKDSDEPMFSIGKPFTNEKDGAVPDISSDETEEQFFQSSLIWDSKFNINLARAIQKKVKEIPLSTELFTVEYSL